jgi:hypothetical protein
MPEPYLLDVVDFRPEPPFIAWKRNVHSQCGEDGIVEQLLAALGIEHGYFVEFGAWDGRHLSNCAALADRGFGGCFIEGDQARFSDLMAAYPGRKDIARVEALVGLESETRLDAILARVDAPTSPTVVSIDIDGMDYHVWDSLKEFTPAICIVEFNPTIPSHVVFVQARDNAVHQGCSLAALWQLGHGKGYALAAVTEFNAIFVRRNLCDAHGIQTFTPDEVKPRTYETAFFQGFDGQIFIAGNCTLLWHGIAFQSENLQVLPKDLRHFPVGVPSDYHARLRAFLEMRSQKDPNRI